MSNTLTQTALRLTLALQRETALARAGSLPALAEAAAEKQEAFTEFSRACEMHGVDNEDEDGSKRNERGRRERERAREAVRALLAAADENALVLEAVGATLEHTAKRLRAALASAADPGTYGPTGRGPRHVLAARLDAQV